MKTIDKYLVEKNITSKPKDLKPLITSPKSGKFVIDGVEVKVTKAGDVIIFQYPSSEAMITYNLIQTADELKKKSTQMGLRSSKEMKFIIEL